LILTPKRRVEKYPALFTMARTQSVSKTIYLISFIKKHWYLFVLLLVVLPSVISSLKIAKETNNWSYPLFDLATSILTADSKLDKMIDKLQNNPTEVIGMAKPEKGLWNNVKYYAHLSYTIYIIIGLIWLIFVPLIAIYNLIKYFNTSEPYQNFIKASIIFIIYLFVTNTVMLIYNYSIGDVVLNFGDTNKFLAYLTIFKKVLPFHGIYSVGYYLYTLIIK